MTNLPPGVTKAPHLMTPEVIPVREYAYVTVDPRDLVGSGTTLIVDSEVMGLDAFEVRFVKGEMRLQAKSLVGIIPLNERVVLKVSPRVDIANLTHMIDVTGHDRTVLKAFRDYQGRGTASDWIMDLYAESLIDQTDEVLNRGLHRVYVRREGEGSFPHGRIAFGRTINRHAARGVRHKVSFDWFERVVDNGPNRCLKAALLRVHAHLTRGDQQKGYRALVARLAGQLASFDDVGDDPAQEFLHDPEVTGHRPMPEARDYYRAPLDLALLILRDRGLMLEADDQAEDDVRLPSLLIDMNTLFEKYVQVSLEHEAVKRGWPIQVLDGNSQGKVPLYEEPATLPVVDGASMTALCETDKKSPKATPDLVFRMPDLSVPLVGEIKNTIKSGTLPDRDEVNQAVTYATRYGLDKVLLVHPFMTGVKGLSYCGRIGNVDLYDYKVDLNDPDMQQVMSDFADALSGLVPANATTPVPALIAG